MKIVVSLGTAEIVLILGVTGVVVGWAGTLYAGFSESKLAPFFMVLFMASAVAAITAFLSFFVSVSM